ncbi:tight adherence protein B [Pullulanibacillus pueri]|uniref:Type II secretion system protein GspF domain-containing protein n=1 Tax=Pullulanibacillus pueri TaxID=1437324 RepID=A0A8J2ZUM0_9BACL|nr:type II secretion system F family protein [Pullulanibacillus pueri]MBM7681318.1 tight adherence protein B [Pullulanibacillus pueri]GGH77611.1 hypothetical protein GCM10007096_09760 [Pullulanibacillus pueri]
MVTNIILGVILVGLISALFFSISRRKKREGIPKEQPEINVEKEKVHSSALSERMKKYTHTLQKPKGRSHLTYYAEYDMKPLEYGLYATLAGIFLFFVGYLFYSTIIVACGFALLGLFYPKMRKKALLEKRKEQLRMQFKEAISSLSSSLAAGRSTENSFREVLADLSLLYPDPNTYIIREFQIINSRVENGEPIERALEDFARRSDIEDIQNFSDVFITCKRTGGDLVMVIRRTTDIITEKLDIQQEVSVMIAQKRFESKVLSIIPIFVILLLKYSSGGYMDPLYDWGSLGPFVMTVCLFILGLSYWLGQKIMKIKV